LYFASLVYTRMHKIDCSFIARKEFKFTNKTSLVALGQSVSQEMLQLKT